MHLKFSLPPLQLDKSLRMPIFLLILLDQMIKLILYFFIYLKDYPLIGSFLRIFPIINTNLSWPGNYLSLFQNFYFLLILNVLILFLAKYLYLFYKRKVNEESPVIKSVYIIFQAGAIASLLDKLFWGGSLDYVMVNEAFIFDLKDCYLTISVFIIVIVMFKNYRYLKKIKRMEFLRFVFQKREEN